MAARPTKITGMKPHTGVTEVLWDDGTWRPSKKGVPGVVVIELTPEDFANMKAEAHEDAFDAGPDGNSIRLGCGWMSCEDIRPGGA